MGTTTTTSRTNIKSQTSSSSVEWPPSSYKRLGDKGKGEGGGLDNGGGSVVEKSYGGRTIYSNNAKDVRLNDGGGSVVETSYTYTVRRGGRTVYSNNVKDVRLFLFFFFFFGGGGR